jgi:putative ABC transport system permease protein
MAELQLTARTIDLAQARASLGRIEILAARDAASRQTLEEARTATAQASNAVAQTRQSVSSADLSIRIAEEQLAELTVRAPFAGTVTRLDEIVVPVDIKAAADGTTRTLALRGMDEAGPVIRDGITLSQGRLFTAGAREILVGDRLANEFGLNVGDTVRLGAVDWTVAGHFSAHGSAFESEIWGHLDAVRAAFDRQGQVQSFRLHLTGPASLERLQEKLATITGTPLVAVSEADLYAAQSGRTASLIRLFGWPVALLMAVGATAGALNTMMSSVSDRTVEIATFRALGFGRLSAFLGTWVEAVILASFGVVLGLVASWFAFNGWQASTIGANNARMAFQLTVTPDVMLTAGLLGLTIGILGGALPAIAATRLPLTAALRARGSEQCLYWVGREMPRRRVSR